jgi:hypothetical protein
MNYVICKAATGWAVMVDHGTDHLDRIGSYPSRKAAITSARLLAGIRGTVRLECR